MAMDVMASTCLSLSQARFIRSGVGSRHHHGECEGNTVVSHQVRGYDADRLDDVGHGRGDIFEMNVDSATTADQRWHERDTNALALFVKKTHSGALVSRRSFLQLELTAS
jgi:hypothetical protein